MNRALVLAVAAMSTALVQPAGPGLGSEGRAAPDYTFVSMPDFLNADVADLSGSPMASWDDGDPIATTSEYEEQIGIVLDEVAREGARDVLVAGDMVEGRWGMDVEETGIFGPVDTYEQKVEAVRRAAGTYYPAWKQRFDVRGLETFTSLGDHEIGDGHWNGLVYGPYAEFKHQALGVFKSEWATYLNGGGNRFANHPKEGQARKTAYATMLHPEVLLVTMDVFRRTKLDVVVDPGPAQLGWLRSNLARARAAGVDWVVVQGHIPVLRPVRATRSSFPKLKFQDGRSSEFWRTLARYDVDLYLAGEVHATTAKRDRGVLQISHGGLFYVGEASYLVGRVFRNRLEIETRAFDASVLEDGPRFWQTMRRTSPVSIDYRSESHRTGSMGLTRSGEVLYRTGLLKPWHG